MTGRAQIPEMLRLLYLAFIYCWYDGSLFDLWPLKILTILHYRYGLGRMKLWKIAPDPEEAIYPYQGLSFAPSPPVPRDESSSSSGVASVRDVENDTPVPDPAPTGGGDGVAPASHVPLVGSGSGSVREGGSGSTISEGQRQEYERNDNDLKRSVIADKLTPLMVLISIVSDLDVVADWVFFKEGLGGEGQVIYITTLVFAVVGTIMFILVTVEFHIISEARTRCSGKPLSPLQHVSLGWQLAINAILEDIPQLVITCVTSPTSAAGVLNITTSVFALLTKIAGAFAAYGELPMSSLLRMIEADPGVVRHMMEQRRNAEELAEKAAKIADLVNRFRKGADDSTRQVAIAFSIMQVDPGFLDGELDYIRETLQAPMMELKRGCLKGPIPPSLGNLTQLASLDLSSNKLSGLIPPSLGDLTQLTYLDLSWCELSGPIPPLGKLTRLTKLDLSFNILSGPIPPSLGELTQLTNLELIWNKLSGPIPPSLGKLTQLTVLDLGHNILSGPIPPSLGELTQLTVLDLGHNELSGPIPPFLGDLTQLTVLILYSNKLSGSIPSGLSRLAALTQLGLGYNQFTGPIPSALDALTALEFIDVQHNELTGPIPDLRQTALREAHLYENKFDGNKADARCLLPKNCVVRWTNYNR